MLDHECRCVAVIWLKGLAGAGHCVGAGAGEYRARRCAFSGKHFEACFLATLLSTRNENPVCVRCWLGFVCGSTERRVGFLSL